MFETKYVLSMDIQTSHTFSNWMNENKTTICSNDEGVEHVW